MEHKLPSHLNPLDIIYRLASGFFGYGEGRGAICWGCFGTFDTHYDVYKVSCFQCNSRDAGDYTYWVLCKECIKRDDVNKKMCHECRKSNGKENKE